MSIDQDQLDILRRYVRKGKLPKDLVYSIGYAIGLIDRFAEMETEPPFFGKPIKEDPPFRYPIAVEVRPSKKPAVCHRGTMMMDASGDFFPHVPDPTSGICIHCGDGAPPPPPEAFEKKPEGNRIETVGCAEHGSHKLEVRPDGSYDKPDCAMFR